MNKIDEEKLFLGESVEFFVWGTASPWANTLWKASSPLFASCTPETHNEFKGRSLVDHVSIRLRLAWLPKNKWYNDITMTIWQWYSGSLGRIANKEWQCNKCDSLDSLRPENTLAAINDLRDFVEDFLQSSLPDSWSIFWQVITSCLLQGVLRQVLAALNLSNPLCGVWWVGYIHTKTTWTFWTMLEPLLWYIWHAKHVQKVLVDVVEEYPRTIIEKLQMSPLLQKGGQITPTPLLPMADQCMMIKPVEPFTLTPPTIKLLPIKKPTDPQLLTCLQHEGQIGQALQEGQKSMDLQLRYEIYSSLMRF